MKFTKTFPMVLVALTALAAGIVSADTQVVFADSSNAARGGSSHSNFKAGFGRHHGGHSEMQQQLFKQIDADGDGKITQKELDTFRAAKVKAADTNKDGALSLEEFEPIYQEMTRKSMVRAFQRLDTNGDGVISQEEMDDRFGTMMQRMEKKGQHRQ